MRIGTHWARCFGRIDAHPVIGWIPSGDPRVLGTMHQEVGLGRVRSDGIEDASITGERLHTILIILLVA